MAVNVDSELIPALDSLGVVMEATARADDDEYLARHVGSGVAREKAHDRSNVVGRVLRAVIPGRVGEQDVLAAGRRNQRQVAPPKGIGANRLDGDVSQSRAVRRDADDHHRAAAVDRVEGLLDGRRAADGLWRLARPHSGKVFFRLETPGAPSRWNTLRALRVLKWWQA